MLQCLMNVAIVILVTGSGMPTGFSAILLPQLQANDSSLPTDDDWASWIGELYQQLKIVPINILFCFEVMRYFEVSAILKCVIFPRVEFILFHHK